MDLACLVPAWSSIAPPIVETVLGVQFSPLPGMTAAHLGWFWKQFLGPERDSATNATPIPDQFERFGEQQQWQSLQRLRILLDDGTATGRIQVTRDQGERMIQIQPSRFHYDWQKREGVYPRYDRVRKAFDAHFGVFGDFVVKAGIGCILRDFLTPGGESSLERQRESETQRFLAIPPTGVDFIADPTAGKGLTSGAVVLERGSAGPHACPHLPSVPAPKLRCRRFDTQEVAQSAVSK